MSPSPADQLPAGSPSTSRLYAVRLLLLLNVAMFAVEIALGGPEVLQGAPKELLLMLGANFAPAIWEGEVWRLLASAFLHGNLIHILVNLYGLYILGQLLESVLGGWQTLVLYAGSALVGSAASVAFSGQVSVGASGAVFGFAGALLAYTWMARNKEEAGYMRRSLVFIVVLNIGLGWLINASGSAIRIDNHAHVGGLLGGMTLGLGILGARLRGPFNPVTLAGYGAFALLSSGVVGMARQPPESAPLRALAGFQALEAGKLDEARNHLETGRSLSPMDPEVLALEAEFCRQKHDMECSQKALDRLLTLDPLPTGRAPQAVHEVVLHTAISQLGQLALKRQDWSLATRLFGRLALLAPGDASSVNNFAWALLCMPDKSPEQVQQALVYADRARRLSRAEQPSVNHTYAEALHQAGRSAEALELLWGMKVDAQEGMGRLLNAGGKMSPDFFQQEIERIQAGEPLDCKE